MAILTVSSLGAPSSPVPFAPLAPGVFFASSMIVACHRLIGLKGFSATPFNGRNGFGLTGNDPPI